MISAKRNAANQRNAARSTGPRTDEGKRCSSVNAMRHGLTTSIESSIWAPHLQSLQALLESDGLNPPEAGDLAFCILSYERNVQSRRKLHHALRHLMRAANQLIRQCQGLTICGILIKFTERTHSVIGKRGYLRSTLFSGDYDVLFP